MVKRLSASICIAFGLLVFNLPMPALGSSSAPPGRILINAPEMPTVDVNPTAGIAASKGKHELAATKGFVPNHVKALSATNLQLFRSQGLNIVTNRDGEWQVSGNFAGEQRLFTTVDGILPSGRLVVGFGTTAMPAASPTGLLRATSVEAGSRSFLICSYAWMNSFYDDLHVHLCNVDATYLAAIITVLEAAVGGLVGVWIGSAVGGVVGIAAGTIAAVLTLVFFWTHSDAFGNVDFVIPHWTMMPPYGGNILWSDVRVWDYMADQCWIKDGGRWYAPKCTY